VRQVPYHCTILIPELYSFQMIKRSMERSLFVYFFLYCCVGWGYIVAFTKIHTMHQIYLHSPPPLLLFIPTSPPTKSCNSFLRYHFLHLHACVQIICTVFILLPTFLTPSSLPLVPTNTLPAVLPSYSLILYKKKIKDKKKNVFASLR
jgi:hypothetical protein